MPPLGYTSTSFLPDSAGKSSCKREPVCCNSPSANDRRGVCAVFGEPFASGEVADSIASTMVRNCSDKWRYGLYSTGRLMNEPRYRPSCVCGWKPTWIGAPDRWEKMLLTRENNSQSIT